MDPISATSGVFSLIVSCKQISEYISDYIRRVQNVDKNIHSIEAEVTILLRVLNDIELTQTDSSFSGNPPEQLRASETAYWGNLFQAIKDCEETLNDLAKILDTVTSGTQSRFVPQKLSLEHRFQTNSHEINLLRQKITVYRQVLLLAFSLITVYVFP